MVVGPKKALQNVPSKSRISLLKIQNLTSHKRNSVVTLVYGTLLIIAGIITFAIDPLDMYVKWFVDMKEGKFVYNMWSLPTYEVFSDIYVFNYTNVPEFLSGKDKQLRVEEVGPYTFQEIRTNENITIDKERGVMTMNPVIKLKFLGDKSVGRYSDRIVTPNIALVAMSTLLADQVGYIANAAAYYSMTALGSKLFVNVNTEEFFWGYDDPIVHVASKLLPGWIDFGKIGILDRFYAQRKEQVEVELGNYKKRYSINSWNGSPGLPEQGFKTLNESIKCNRLKGTYEGLMISPGYNVSNPIPVFRKQACRVYPFSFLKEMTGDLGFSYTRFQMEESAFNRTNRYACKCTKNCLPDGFVDIGSCYYGFPIALSKPHLMDTDPEQQKHFTGMSPDRIAHASYVDMETKIGVPLSMRTNMQVNIAVRSSGGNPITRPVKDVVLPIMWLSLHCEGPPSEIASLLRLRYLIAPPLILATEIIIVIIGSMLLLQSIHRLWKPKYKPVRTEEKVMIKGVEPRKSSIALNVINNNAFDDQESAREAASLLVITEEDNDLAEMIVDEC